MRIALAQMKMTPEIEINYQKSIRLIAEAAQQGVSLILFPEIQLTPFFPQYENEDVSDYLMTIDNPYVEGICRACRKNRIFASPNIYIEENSKRYDMSLLINDEGRIIGRQKMVHIAQCEKFYEQTYYEPSELFQWEIKIQAFQNSVNIAMCNRVGKEGDVEFSGESIVSDYLGKTVGIAGRDEELLITDIDLSGATITRKKKPYTSLRRPEMYY